MATYLEDTDAKPSLSIFNGNEPAATIAPT
jgi:hypothetical protein